MATAFVDTSFLIATYVRTDQWHAASASVDLSELRLVTSSSIVDETITYLQRRSRFSAAIDLLRGLTAAGQIEIVVPTRPVQEEA